MSNEGNPLAAGAQVVERVTAGLGWPRHTEVDPRVGWPDVPRGTLSWTRDPAGLSEPDAPASGGGEQSADTESVPEADADEEPEAPPGAAPPSDSATADTDDIAAKVDPSVAIVRPLTPPVPSEQAGAAPAVSPPRGPQPAGPVATTVITAPSEVLRPPGPRRARFDTDEFETPSVELEPGAVSRETRGPRTTTFPAPATTRIFVVANQKGGVGKTTSAVNLAAALALGGLSVLVVDLDPQGNASTALGIDHEPGTLGTYEVIIDGDRIADHVVASPEAPQLMVLPATVDLAGAEIELVSTVARENRLLRALRAYLAEHQVDYVFIDCPPSLGLLTLNALVAASEILIPIQCEYYALEGVSQLMRTINLVKGELNDRLELSTVLLTMSDARTRLSAQVSHEVRTHFAAQTLHTAIPRSVRISEAPSYGQTVLTYHPESAGAVSYLEAAREIAHRGAKESA